MVQSMLIDGTLLGYQFGNDKRMPQILLRYRNQCKQMIPIVPKVVMYVMLDIVPEIK